MQLVWNYDCDVDSAYFSKAAIRVSARLALANRVRTTGTVCVCLDDYFLGEV